MTDAEKYRTLIEAGPGHMIYSAKWSDREGKEESATLLLPIEADGRDALRGMGWPGHAGRRIDYFKEDAKRFFRSLLGH